jgi:tetratricopeptide (TPR) repeat protein
MVEYMNEHFGSSAIVGLLGEYFRGAREEEAMLSALGVSREVFFEGFKTWAGEQVAAWGLDPSPTLDELADRVRERSPEAIELLAEAKRQRLRGIAAQLGSEVGRAGADGAEPAHADAWPAVRRPPIEIDDETLAEFLEEFPDHPDVLELSIHRRLGGGSLVAGEVRTLLERYASVRPVDPFPHRVLAQALIERDEATKAIASLKELDVRSEKDNAFALQLASLLRSEGRLEEAQEAAERAVRMDPYRPEHHELAAAIAIERRDFGMAKQHIEALRVLEPDQPQHVRRIKAIERLLGNDGVEG